MTWHSIKIKTSFHFCSITAGLYKTSFLFYSSGTGFILLEQDYIKLHLNWTLWFVMSSTPTNDHHHFSFLDFLLIFLARDIPHKRLVAKIPTLMSANWHLQNTFFHNPFFQWLQFLYLKINENLICVQIKHDQFSTSFAMKWKLHFCSIRTILFY